MKANQSVPLFQKPLGYLQGPLPNITMTEGEPPITLKIDCVFISDEHRCFHNATHVPFL
jgi:hypothetical protein